MADLNQPEIPGPGGLAIHIPDDVYRRMKDDIESDADAGGGFEPLAGMSDLAKDLIRKFEDSARDKQLEHVRVYDLDGVETYRKIGDPDSVPIDLAALSSSLSDLKAQHAVVEALDGYNM